MKHIITICIQFFFIMMAEKLCTDHKFDNYCLVFILGSSGSGKSEFVKNIILESDYHFKGPKIPNIVYVYSSFDDNLKELQNKKAGITFVKELPLNWKEKSIPGSLYIFDDQECKLNSSKPYSDVINEIATIYVHHFKLKVFILLQTYDCLYKSCRINPSINQLTNLVIFRVSKTDSTLKRFLNTFNISLKENRNLFDVFTVFTKELPHSYLMINISPFQKRATCFSNILLCDGKNLLTFHSDDNKTD